MSVDSQLFLRVGGFLYSSLSLVDLANWPQDHEEHWAALASDNEARRLADAMMLTMYEVDSGQRDEESARTLLRDVALESFAP